MTVYALWCDCCVIPFMRGASCAMESAIAALDLGCSVINCCVCCNGCCAVCCVRMALYTSGVHSCVCFCCFRYCARVALQPLSSD